MHCTNHKYRARTGKVTLQWSVARSVARRRKPQGKGGGIRLVNQAAPARG